LSPCRTPSAPCPVPSAGLRIAPAALPGGESPLPAAGPLAALTGWRASCWCWRRGREASGRTRRRLTDVLRCTGPLVRFERHSTPTHDPAVTPGEVGIERFTWPRLLQSRAQLIDGETAGRTSQKGGEIAEDRRRIDEGAALRTGGFGRHHRFIPLRLRSHSPDIRRRHPITRFRRRKHSAVHGAASSPLPTLRMSPTVALTERAVRVGEVPEAVAGNGGSPPTSRGRALCALNWEPPAAARENADKSAVQDVPTLSLPQRITPVSIPSVSRCAMPSICDGHLDTARLRRRPQALAPAFRQEGPPPSRVAGLQLSRAVRAPGSQGRRTLQA
jgi:hypothetical protein